MIETIFKSLLRYAEGQVHVSGGSVYIIPADSKVKSEKSKKLPSSLRESFDNSAKLKNEISFSNVVVAQAAPILRELAELSKPVENSEKLPEIFNKI